jgi:universal stress protein A
MKTILAPVDFSTSSTSVIDTATELATALSAEIVLLHVVTPPIVASEYGLVMENVSEIVAAAEKASTVHLTKMLQSVSDQGVKTRTHQAVGSPVETILQIAAEEACDYIVMGSHGHSAFYDLLIGSTTHGVLHKAPCPVLIVPRQAP